MPTRREQLREELRWNTPMFASACLSIVDKNAQTVRLEARPWQRRLDDAMEQQRLEGKPVRVIVLKARQLGFCLDPATKVLTADLRWVPIDSMRPGDEIVAVDEETPGGRGRARRMRRGVVEAKREVREAAYRLTMDTGQTLIATPEHRFLSRWGTHTACQWRQVKRMKPGDRIRYITAPWGEGDYEDGWMGGMIDGEGSMRKKESGGAEVTICQRLGTVYDRACDYLKQRGYTFREDLDSRKAGDTSKLGNLPVGRLVLARMNELFRLAGQTRPTRLIESRWWEDRELPGKRSGMAWSRIVSIEPLGERRMIDLQTSHRTFIAEGFVSHNSTWVQAKFIQAVTQRENQRGLVIAQDKATAAQLFQMGKMMYDHLPTHDGIKPDTISNRRSQGMDFAPPLQSSIKVDTAQEVAAGRGFTFTQLHASEAAFWPDVNKLLALMAAVPDREGTMIVLESTANGHNWFRDRWVRAIEGKSDYIPFFAAWHEDPEYARPFANEEEKAAFVETIGEGEWGEDEPRLVEKFGCSPEQLHWRRWTIYDKADADLDRFKQEFPSEWQEAFITTGRSVFSQVIVAKVLDRTEETDRKAERGIFKAGATKSRHTRNNSTIEVPTKAEWWPEAATGHSSAHPFVRIWEHPKPEGQYVIGVDVAGGEETTKGETVFHAIQVIDHKTLEQVAEYRSRIDPDELAHLLFLIGLYYNEGWIAVEVTGGWGGPVIRRLRHDYAYRFLYYRPNLETKNEKQSDRLGWDTNRRSKPLLEEDLRQQLREGTDGIKSALLANELTTYVKDERGRTGPDDGKFSDLLMAYMVAQTVAREKAIRSKSRAKKWATTNDERMGY